MNTKVFVLTWLLLLSANTFFYVKFYWKPILEDKGQFAIYMILNFFCTVIALTFSELGG